MPILRPCHKTTGLSLPPNPTTPVPSSTRIQQQRRDFKSITGLMIRTERPHKTGCGQIFIKHQRISMKDQYFEYCQLWEISPIKGTKKTQSQDLALQKRSVLLLTKHSFSFLTAFTYPDTEKTQLNSFTSNKFRGATGPV